ncbi:MAG: purine-nucleoside phosphorylase [Spirochaetae bacterium HGW-Spirochaetae-3]|jgi:purine-nucleoside phosphorylase|nr:MAG: purine-nucleoside phosphorylase [Spirochaetae bacterium HGW-Spirochaetae-3]
MEKTRNVKAAADYVRARAKRVPSIALMLGSGLGGLAKEVQDTVCIPYGDIPGFPVSTAPGHAGVLTAGRLQDRDVIVMGGRFHHYEGYGMEDIAFPVRVMRDLGVETLILTNAAGGVNTSFKPGDLMVITDHINMTGQNPLRGANDESLGPRFPDMGGLYDKRLNGILRKVAEERSIDCRSGVYAWMTGPSFETPAEIRMLRVLGADAVGMSTVPEAITAHHCGIRVAGVSCISNMAAGVLDQPVTEEEVFEITQRVKGSFSALIRGLLERIDEGR